MSLEKRYTRFRAYQLDTEGSSFSYFDGKTFTLIEGRFNDTNRSRVLSELSKCGKKSIDVLHITSWDDDHCASAELIEILKVLKPNKIEYPGYDPHTDNGKEAQKKIKAYGKVVDSAGKSIHEVIKVDPDYIKSLEAASQLGYKNILYNPLVISEVSNDNSVVQLFRTGSFNVASLGDVESSMISSRLRRNSIFKSELDVMILAHHGAENQFTTSKFLKEAQPAVAICSSNYDNQYEHPKEEIRKMLTDNDIALFTTKTGDVIIESVEPHTHKFRVYNFVKDNQDLSSVKNYSAKKRKILGQNKDSLKNYYDKSKPFYKGIK